MVLLPLSYPAERASLGPRCTATAHGGMTTRTELHISNVVTQKAQASSCLWGRQQIQISKSPTYACTHTHSHMLASFPGFTRALVLRPIRKSTAFSALYDWSEYECMGKARERGYTSRTHTYMHTRTHASTYTNVHAQCRLCVCSIPSG